ncbi:MAG: radical SAM protein [Alphaproteobacteria bacterium]|nr:radical SAM protein [Alphaproteobacteria bacterium]
MKQVRERIKDQYQGKSEQDFLVTAPAMPKQLMVELSNACNHACVFCANPTMQRKVGRIKDEFLFRLMADARRYGVREISFYTTGEPFVHKGLEKFTAEAKRLGYEYIFITSNGALATPERAVPVIEAGIDSIKFSLNAGDRESYKAIHGKDDWDAVVNNIRFISEYREKHALQFKLYIGFVLTQATKYQPEKLRELLGDKVDDIIVAESHDLYGQVEDSQDMLMIKPQRRREGICYQPFNRLHVTCEGYLTICCGDFNNFLAVCDLNEMSLEEAWLSPRFRDVRQRHLDRRLEGMLCDNCWNGSVAPVHPLNEDLADDPASNAEVGSVD